MAAPNFEIISEIYTLQRRDVYVNDTTLLNPSGTNPILDGEWLNLDATSMKAARGSGTLAVPSWPVFAERGRYDVRATEKLTLCWLGQLEGITSIYTSTSLVVGSPLVVGDVTFGGQTRKGLKLLPTAAGTYGIVGYVTSLAGSKCRFVTTALGAPQRIVVP